VPPDRRFPVETWEPAAPPQGPPSINTPQYSGEFGGKPVQTASARATVAACGKGRSMGDQVELVCRCGEVRARVTDASPRTVNRIVCYCDDCQAFAHRIGRADLLDSQGGREIVQLAPATLTFLQGQQRIVGLRLTPKGLFRWYASCCNTPVGNTLTPAIP